MKQRLYSEQTMTIDDLFAFPGLVEAGGFYALGFVLILAPALLGYGGRVIIKALQSI
jgi:hypothetical protein